MTVVVVTRPAREAAVWVQALGEAGWHAQALPLIDVGEAPDPRALQVSRTQIDRYSALMFVSAQAVDRFWAASGPGPVTDGTVRHWAPGPGTARALVAAGVPLTAIDAPPADAAQFDSEALWAVVAPQVVTGHRLLCVRGVSANGRSGRDWLIHQCEAAGGHVDVCVAYQRQMPHWTAGEAQQVRARLSSNGTTADEMPNAIWLFSSSEALSHLRALCPDLSWAGVWALVTHPRIEAAAHLAGFGRVLLCRPALSDVLARLESLK